MRKNLLTAGLIVVLLAMTAIPAIAQDGDPEKGPKAPPRTRPHGQSNVGHLLLMHKTDDTGVPPWDPIWPGAFGVLKYNREGLEFEYHFNGHGLMLDTSYSLIYYADPWPGNNPGALIASGITDNEGNLHLKGSIDLGMDLPHPDDENFEVGAKIWLVPSNDYEATDTDHKMIAWHPEMYLFEYDKIFYYDTDVPNNNEG